LITACVSGLTLTRLSLRITIFPTCIGRIKERIQGKTRRYSRGDDDCPYDKGILSRWVDLVHGVIHAGGEKVGARE
jgi:hypothetical protein